MNFQDFPRPNLVEKKLREIDDTPQSSKFREILECSLGTLLKERFIRFSDIVTCWSGLSQLIYEDGRYCFGEDDGSTTELNDMQKIRLEYARERLKKIFIGIYFRSRYRYILTEKLCMKRRGDYSIGDYICQD